ncbi:MAG TPA: hypothetical protein VGJ21_07490 [Terracidiphilus sp.]|jgi:hypothetical protein
MEQPPSRPEYLHNTIDAGKSKYKNLNFVDFFFATQSRTRRPINAVQFRMGIPAMSENSTSLISKRSTEDLTPPQRLPRWIKVTAVAVASALAGGVAAAWFYRKTVSRLQNAVEIHENSKSNIDTAEADEG